MKKLLENILKTHFYNELTKTRTRLNYTQAKMADILVMDERSYVELDHGNSLCSALTLVLFLIYCCADVSEFLFSLKIAFEEIDNDAA